MNLNDNPTIEQLGNLLQQADDLAGHHVLWVTKSGEVVLSRLPKDYHLTWPPPHFPDAQMCAEVYRLGKGYVGPKAAADEEWVSALFHCLVGVWLRAKRRTRVVALDTINGARYFKPTVEEPLEPRAHRPGEKHWENSMNLNNNPGMDQLRDLLKQDRDLAGHHVVWVRKDGEVILSRIPKGQKPIWPEQEHPDMQMCTEVYWMGKEYVGEEAAADDAWVTTLFHCLVRAWPGAKQGTGVVHLDTTSGPEDELAAPEVLHRCQSS